MVYVRLIEVPGNAGEVGAAFTRFTVNSVGFVPAEVNAIELLQLPKL